MAYTKRKGMNPALAAMTAKKHDNCKRPEGVYL